MARLKTETIQFKIPQEEKEWFVRYCDRNMHSQSALLRGYILSLMKNEQQGENSNV